MVAAETTSPVREASLLDYQRGAHSTFVLGVDLGQSIDPTAICLVERLVAETGKLAPYRGVRVGATEWRRELSVAYRCRAAELLPLGTNYRAIVDHIAGRFSYIEGLGRAELAFDETGARAAGDMIRAAIPNAIGCTLTGGEKDQRIKEKGQRWSVSKANMVSGLLAALENRDIEIAGDLPGLDDLKKHLTDLRRKISALGHHSFNARKGAHDDFVTALGLAWWNASRPKAFVGERKMAFALI